MDNTSATIPGKLYIVATPIGNLQDISLRAIATLKEVDVILAEDTRHSAGLCHALGISKPLLAYHEHNETNKSEHIISALIQGQSFALISDAGTPLISDPGYVLVREARKHKISVIPVPGCCALIAALCASGIPCEQFQFIGFLPAKNKARMDSLTQLKEKECTILCYESTHRILESMDSIAEVFGEDYFMVLAKELTKSFEHFESNSVRGIKAWLLEEPGRTKGEFVLIFPPVPKVSASQDPLLKILLKELPLKQAVKIASQLCTTPRNELYQRALTLKEDNT